MRMKAVDEPMLLEGSIKPCIKCRGKKIVEEKLNLRP
jgi:hypothetical protein